MEGSEGCVCLMSKVGVGTLWVCLSWSVGASDVVGVSYRGCCSPLLVFTGVACVFNCLLYTSPSPRDATLSRMPSSA